MRRLEAGLLSTVNGTHPHWKIPLGPFSFLAVGADAGPMLFKWRHIHTDRQADRQMGQLFSAT